MTCDDSSSHMLEKGRPCTLRINRCMIEKRMEQTAVAQKHQPEGASGAGCKSQPHLRTPGNPAGPLRSWREC